MVQMYQVFGRQVGSHHLAMGVLGALFGGTYLAVSGPSKKKAVQTPPINASSPDEADFIQNFLKQQDAEEKKAKH
ncbi:Uu.00g054260.m01.CDS01 [Anthostomella pinea]|uniref:Uu.00g054260.m01.CDS01 n=1 Tax=Anthostomella pinea TaxID=933095 RepID=A0AAI8YPQ9_9PEZI|nr:Uu.00g054260.m01.CDS01 [Anthostomella pinea]